MGVDAPGPATRFTDDWTPSDAVPLLREVVERGSAIRRVIARRAGLSENELEAIEHLVRAPLGLAELSSRLDVSRPAATGIAERLVHRGHVVRESVSEDRRRTRIRLTPSGREEVLTHLIPMFTELAENDAGFSEDERAVVARYLGGALRAYDRIDEHAEEVRRG